jgi:hypothetical protein
VTERSPVAAAWLAVGAVVALCLYVAAFRGVGVGNLGWDAPGSVVQMRAASAGILDLPGSRPGVAVTGAFVAGAGLTPIGVAPIVLSIVAAASLGLAAAIGLRRTWDVPAWGLAVTVVVVATWGGTARLAAGFLANLLSLVLFVFAIVLAIVPGPSWWAVAIAFATALLAHPGLLPAYGAILVGWVLLEVAIPPDRDPGGLRSVRAAAAFGAASLLVVLVVGAWLRVSLDDLQDLAIARERFHERAAEFLVWIDPVLTLAMIAAGLVLLVAQRDRGRSRAAMRLGIAWLAVSAGGLVLLALAPQVPGHRTLLLGVPAPVLGAVGLVGGSRWLSGRTGEASRVGRAVILTGAGVATLALALLSLGPFDARAARPSGTLGPGPGAVAGYLRTLEPRRPVILVMDPADGRELLAWKARLNAVRALAPDPIFLDVVLYVGDERSLLAGRATVRSGDARFEAIVARTWPSVRAVLDDDPVVLVVRPWVSPDAWRRVADEASVVGEDVAVVRGPVPAGGVGSLAEPRLPVLDAAIRVVLLLVVLSVVGAGWSALAIGRGDRADVAGLAPAAGLAVVTLVGVAVAVARADPGGAPGVIAVGIAGAIGWLLAWRRRPAPET